MTKTIGIFSLTSILLLMILLGSRNAAGNDAPGPTFPTRSTDRSTAGATSGTTLTTAGFSLMTPTPIPVPATPDVAETAPTILDTLTLAPGDAVDRKPRRTRRVETPRGKVVEKATTEEEKPAKRTEPAAPRTRTPQRHDDAGPVSGDAPALLTVPVAGVVRRSLVDTWGATRSEGRAHEGIDIFAEKNTPVLAAADGRITRQGESERGGLVVWVQGAGGLRHYYAHLEAYSDHSTGDRVRAGDTIGYVGNTGNAITTPPHLHYGVYTDSGAINPYPLLVRK